MRHLIRAPFLALCLLAMPACGTAGQAVALATQSQPLGDAITFDERGMIAVEALYNVPAQAYVTADTRNLPGWASIKPTVRPLLLDLRRIRDDVRAAYGAGDARGFRERVAALRTLRDRIMSRFPAGATN